MEKNMEHKIETGFIMGSLLPTPPRLTPRFYLRGNLRRGSMGGG